MPTDEFWSFIKDNMLSLVTVAVGVIVLILHGLGSISSQAVGSTTLAVVALLATSEIVERQRRLSKLERLLMESRNGFREHDKAVLTALDRSATHIIHALKGAEIKTFDAGSEFVSYFLERVQSAKLIDDINWRDERVVRSKRESDIVDVYQRVMVDTASKRDVIWREIVVFSDEHRFERVKQLLQANIRGYNVAYYETIPTDAPPRITFAVVDNEEVFLASPKTRLAIRHPEVAGYFSQYYENIWSRGKILKLGDKLNQEELERLDDLYRNT